VKNKKPEKEIESLKERIDKLTGPIEREILINPGLARELIKEGFDSQDSPAYHAAHAVACSEQQEFDKAAGHFERLIELNPDLADAYNGLCLALIRGTYLQSELFEPEDIERLEGLCTKAFEINSDSKQAKENLRLVLSACIYSGKENYGQDNEKAAAFFEKAAELDQKVPGCLEKMSAVGEMNSANIHLELARAYFQTAYDRASEGKSGEYEEKILEHLKIALELIETDFPSSTEPTPARVHAALADYHRHAKEFDDAEYHIKKALKLDPKQHAIHYIAAVIYCLTGEKEKAADHLEKAELINECKIRVHYYSHKLTAMIAAASKEELNEYAEKSKKYDDIITALASDNFKDKNQSELFKEKLWDILDYDAVEDVRDPRIVIEPVELSPILTVPFDMSRICTRFGDMYQELGDTENAIWHYEHAIEAHKLLSIEARYKLAIIYRDSNQEDKAIETLSPGNIKDEKEHARKMLPLLEQKLDEMKSEIENDQ